MKNLRELSANPFPYIIPFITRSFLEELVRGEHFVLVDLLKSIPGSSSQVGFAKEPQGEIPEGALAVQDLEPANQFTKKNRKIKASQAIKKKEERKDHNQSYQVRRHEIKGLYGLVRSNR